MKSAQNSLGTWCYSERVGIPCTQCDPIKFSSEERDLQQRKGLEWPGMVVQAYNPCTWEAEVEEL
jgi:hypothetical protein